MTAIDVYKTYLAFKQHFTKSNYDFFKYCGKSKASVQAFNKRKDRYFFEKMSRQKNDEEIKQYFLANFVECDDPQKLWIGEIIQCGDENHTTWMKRVQSLSYKFKEDVSILFEDQDFDLIFSAKNGKHPIILRKLHAKTICLETFVILDMILRFCKDFDRILLDPIWEFQSMKVQKYAPFLNIDLDQYKKILKEKVTHG